ncbi:hypothetical protein OG21DRAFT_1522653 [Imleria badia]|nr:hypothetical protein OG21DRAFT_1522653 [Imleria badia]
MVWITLPPESWYWIRNSVRKDDQEGIRPVGIGMDQIAAVGTDGKETGNQEVDLQLYGRHISAIIIIRLHELMGRVSGSSVILDVFVPTSKLARPIRRSCPRGFPKINKETPSRKRSARHVMRSNGYHHTKDRRIWWISSENRSEHWANRGYGHSEPVSEGCHEKLELGVAFVSTIVRDTLAIRTSPVIQPLNGRRAQKSLPLGWVADEDLRGSRSRPLEQPGYFRCGGTWRKTAGSGASKRVAALGWRAAEPERVQRWGLQIEQIFSQLSGRLPHEVTSRPPYQAKMPDRRLPCGILFEREHVDFLTASEEFSAPFTSQPTTGGRARLTPRA